MDPEVRTIANLSFNAFAQYLRRKIQESPSEMLLSILSEELTDLEIEMIRVKKDEKTDHDNTKNQNEKQNNSKK